MNCDTRPKHKSRTAGISVSLSCVVLVFAAEFMTSFGFATGILYVLPIVTLGTLRQEKPVIGLAGFCCGLVVIGGWSLTSPETEDFWRFIINRTLSLFAIVTVAVLTIAQMRKNHVSYLDRKTLMDQEIKIKRLAQELNDSKDELDQFIYVASHDLQEPLRMVASYTELLRRRYEGKFDEKAQRFMEYSVDGAKRMQLLINDLVQFSRAGRTELKITTVNLESLVEDAKTNLINLTNESAASIKCNSAVSVQVDPTQLTKVFTHLFENSIKYCGDTSPEILIESEDQGDHVLISVIDKGIGIAGDHQDRVFQLFHRLDPKGSVEGRGIGLSMAKRFVENHRGKIWFDSQPGLGTTFFVQLPNRSLG